MWVLYTLSLVILILAALWTVACRRSYREQKRLSTRMAVAVWALCAGHAALTGVAAWRGVWPMPVGAAVSVPVAAVFVVIGAAVFAAGAVAFRSLRRMSGLETNVLVSSGVYRWCQNPQSLGWGLILVGVAVFGQSGLALTLVVMFGGVFHIYLVVVEEPYLEQMFGDAYLKYRLNTPRYAGWRKSKRES